MGRVAVAAGDRFTARTYKGNEGVAGLHNLEFKR